jgi:hypothetical protein
MKKIIPLILLSCLFYSCEKNDNSSDETKTLTVCNIVEVLNSSDRSYLTYDTKGRVIKVNYNSANSTDFTTYDYQATKILVMNGNDLTTHLLNSSGLIYKTTTEYPLSKEVIITDYKYNSEGYLIQDIAKNGNSVLTRNLTYSNGNLTKITRPVSLISPSDNTWEILYNNDNYINFIGIGSPLTIPNDVDWYFDAILISGGYFGKAPKNLISGYIFSTNNKTNSSNTITYEKNEKGNIIKQKFKNGYEVSLVYKCQ